MKNNHKYLLIGLFFLIAVGFLLAFFYKSGSNQSKPANISPAQPDTENLNAERASSENFPDEKPSESPTSTELAIENLRQQSYSGGDFAMEENLPDGTNYQRLIASYQSEGLKINGLLTIPHSQKPENGFPAILFLHGYIPPKQYSTVNSYPTYQAALAKSGFITFKPDLRGHADSEGEPVSAHYSEKYVVDTLYALSYLQNHPDVNSDKIGYWGHSNGGEIGLRVAVITDKIDAYVFWAGVVGSYEDLFETYIDQIPFLENDENPLIKQYGLPSENPEFWQKVDPYYHLKNISAPIQLHHGEEDKSVPIELSVELSEALKESNKQVDVFNYPNNDHNISQSTSLAWQRTITFYREKL